MRDDGVNMAKGSKGRNQAGKKFSKSTKAGSAKEKCPPKKKKIIEVKWVEQMLWCSEEATLTGKTENYGNNEKINIKIQDVKSGKKIKAFKVNVVGQGFTHKWQIVDVLPPKKGKDYEEERKVDAYAGKVKSPKPLKIGFLPEAPKKRYASGSARFNLTAKKHRLHIDEDIQYVKGWAASVVKLSAHAPRGTGGLLDGKLNWNGYRWMKTVGVTKKFWDGSAWKNLPRGFRLRDSNNFCVGFYKNGTKYTCQYGGDWPENFTDWNIDARAKQKTIKKWQKQINKKWTGTFKLKREECKSSKKECCRYPIITEAKFTKKNTFSSGRLVIADGNIRSNSGLFFLGDPDAGTFPHEFGHFLGNPDEYAGATSVDTSLNGDGAVNGIDSDSIMGQNMTKVKKRHFRTLAKHFAGMARDKTSKTWKYNAVK
jgi:hypothetical protein